MDKTIDTVIEYLAGELVKEGLVACTEVKTVIEVLHAGLIDLAKLEQIGLLVQAL